MILATQALSSPAQLWVLLNPDPQPLLSQSGLSPAPALGAPQSQPTVCTIPAWTPPICFPAAGPALLPPWADLLPAMRQAGIVSPLSQLGKRRHSMTPICKASSPRESQPGTFTQRAPAPPGDRRLCLHPPAPSCLAAGQIWPPAQHRDLAVFSHFYFSLMPELNKPLVSD